MHLASRLAAGGHAGDAPEAEQDRLAQLAKDVGMARLGRAWQIILKGHGEIGVAPNPHAAADMVLIRLAYAAMMPTPADLVRKLEKSPPGSNFNSCLYSDRVCGAARGCPSFFRVGQHGGAQTARPPNQAVQPPRDDQPSSPDPEPEPAGFAEPDQHRSYPMRGLTMIKPHPRRSLSALVRLFEDRGELLLASTIKLKMRPVKFEDGCFDYQAKGHLEPNVTEKIARLLYDWTGLKWIIAQSDGEAGHTLEEQDAMKLQAEIDEISDATRLSPKCWPNSRGLRFR